MKIIFTSLDGPKKEAKSLLKLVKKTENPPIIKLSQIQDVIACSYGWSSWNDLFVGWKNKDIGYGTHCHWDGLDFYQQDGLLNLREKDISEYLYQLGSSVNSAAEVAKLFRESITPRMIYKDLPLDEDGEVNNQLRNQGSITPDIWTQRMWRGGTFIYSLPHTDTLARFRQQYIIPQVNRSSGLFIVSECEASKLVDELSLYRLMSPFGSVLEPTHMMYLWSTEAHDAVIDMLKQALDSVDWLDDKLKGDYIEIVRCVAECWEIKDADCMFEDRYKFHLGDVIELTFDEEIPENKRGALRELLVDVNIDMAKLERGRYTESDLTGELYSSCTRCLVGMWDWLHEYHTYLPTLSIDDIIDDKIPTIIIVPDRHLSSREMTMGIDALFNVFRNNVLGRASMDATYKDDVSLFYVGMDIDTILPGVSKLIDDAPNCGWSVVFVSNARRLYDYRNIESSQCFSNAINNLSLGCGILGQENYPPNESSNQYNGTWMEGLSFPLDID
tara:strand:- start:1801 stop:3303 length:1503 start_codon:yes stop_codon:yes gene_type:complete